MRDLLEADPGMTRGQLVKATGVAERTIRRCLSKLNAVGTERPGPQGEKGWRLPTAEEQAAAEEEAGE